MQNQSFVNSNNNFNQHHTEVVRSILDEQFSRILVNLDQRTNEQSASSSASASFSSGFSSGSSSGSNQRRGGDSDNSYILDLSRPGEARSQSNALDLVRSDPNSHHLPTCVRSSVGKNSSTTTAKVKGETCQGKCCRPLYVIRPTPIDEDDSSSCKHRTNHASRAHFDVINRIPSSSSPRVSGASSSTSCDDNEMVAGVAGRCPNCGRCRCTRCVEQQPVTCCGGNVTDDCCVDVMTCMCCVKGIAGFFTANNPSAPNRKRKGRHVLPAPNGSPNYPDSDNEDEEGCCGLASSNPCSCHGPGRQRTFRFACLTLLTMFIPCLACYLPCRAAGRGIRWCYNRSRAPDACRCPRSTIPSPTRQSIGSQQPRRYGGTSNSRPQRSQTAPACSKSSPRGKMPTVRSSDFVLCRHNSSNVESSNNDNNRGQLHAKRG